MIIIFYCVRAEPVKRKNNYLFFKGNPITIWKCMYQMLSITKHTKAKIKGKFAPFCELFLVKNCLTFSRMQSALYRTDCVLIKCALLMLNDCSHRYMLAKYKRIACLGN